MRKIKRVRGFRIDGCKKGAKTELARAIRRAGKIEARRGGADTHRRPNR